MLKRFLAWTMLGLGSVTFVLVIVMIIWNRSFFGGHLGFEPRREGEACVVAHLEPEGPLAVAGIQEGDVLVSVDEQQVPAATDLVNWIQSRVQAGAPTKVSVKRANKELVVFPVASPNPAGRALFRFALIPLFLLTILLAMIMLGLMALET